MTMQGFQYQFGDRPLEGYTIQRALGRGGFGEVYYALSDSGRQVALKVIQGYEQIELRGVSQCMNLKSPHLVTIFDVRHNDQGKPFVIMEYVSGPPLRDLLDQCPAGLGTQKAAFFLREIGKGLTYLHDCGIVHRDLKPGNIFYEDGYVKIGDYGLSKAMSASRHSGQTVTVGTVHYMAPEIGAGNYDRSIDIYALGVLLYEMLTGQVPYLGASPGEILMKHMMSEPDVRSIEEPFASVIRRAMVKDPALRYQTVQEMVEAVFGAEHIQNSVSHFSPASLSMVAGRVAREVVGGSAGQGGSGGQVAVGSGPTPPPAPWFAATPTPGPVARAVPPPLPAQAVAINPASDNNNDNAQAAPARQPADPANDPLDFRRRRVLALATAVVIAVGASLLSGHAVQTALFALLAMVGAAGGIVWSRLYLLPRLQIEYGAMYRFGPGLLACGFALLLTGPLLLLLADAKHTPLMPQHLLYGTMAAVAIPLLLMDWAAITAPGRRDRLSLFNVLLPAIIGLVAALLFTGDIVLTLGILAGTVLAAQVASAYDPTVSRFGMAASKAIPAPAGPGDWPGGSAPADPRQPGSPWTSPARPRRVPAPVRALALLAFVTLLGLGLIALIYSTIEELNEHEVHLFVVIGIDAILLSPFFLAKTLRRTFNSWWGDLIKPLLMLLCLMTCVSAFVVVMDSSRHIGGYSLDKDENLVALFLLIFPALLFLVMLFVPNRSVESLFSDPQPPPPSPGSMPMSQPISHRSRLVALLLSAGGFVGVCGLHRFYAGKTGTGILWLVTLGFCGIGQLIDIVMIATGQFHDVEGRRLAIWEGIPAGTGRGF